MSKSPFLDYVIVLSSYSPDFIINMERWKQGQKKTNPREAKELSIQSSGNFLKHENFQCEAETQKIQIIGRIYRVGRGISGSDVGISKYGSRSAAGTVKISTKQSVQ